MAAARHSAGPTEILLALCQEVLQPSLYFISSLSNTMQAVNIHQEDEHLCRLISRIGAQIMPKSGDVLTHCNTVAAPPLLPRAVASYFSFCDLKLLQGVWRQLLLFAHAP
jgi:hypothetical protein